MSFSCSSLRLGDSLSSIFELIRINRNKAEESSVEKYETIGQDPLLKVGAFGKGWMGGAFSDRSKRSLKMK